MSDNLETTCALLLPDGGWARIYTRSTHGGDRQGIESVDLNSADVMPRFRWRKWEKHGVPVEVKETRTVTVVPGCAS